MCCEMAQINQRTKIKVVLESCDPYQVNKKIIFIIFYFRGISGPPKCPNFEKVGILGVFNNTLNKKIFFLFFYLLFMDHSFPKLPLFLF